MKTYLSQYVIIKLWSTFSQSIVPCTEVSSCVSPFLNLLTKDYLDTIS